MPIQSAISRIGAGKQTGKGSAAANPTFYHGLTDGAVLQVDVQQSIEERTSSTRVSPAVNRTGVMAGAEFSCRSHAASTGLWLLNGLGSVSTTGTNPYTHTFTVGSDTNYLTVFGSLASNLYSVRDYKIGELGFAWQGNEPLEMSINGMGTVLGFPGTITPTTDDSTAAYFRPAGGTFTLDVDSATPVAANIAGGEITVNNNLSEIMLSGTITPADVMVGRTEVECSFDLIPDVMDDWRTIVTGTSGGTTASASPIYGSFSCAFTDGTNTLTLAASRVAFTCEFPSSDPSGGAVTITLAGLCVQPAAGGTPITATLVNSTVSY